MARKYKLNNKVVERVIRHLNSVVPGFAYFIDQYTRINYGKSFWWDIFPSDFITAYNILLEYYSYREDEANFILYEILKPMLNNNLKAISDIIQYIRDKKYDKALNIIVNTYGFMR